MADVISVLIVLVCLSWGPFTCMVAEAPVVVQAMLLATFTLGACNA